MPPTIEAKLQEAIDLAEARADSTCEVCGELGRLYDRNDWLVTRCDVHAEGQLVPTHGEAGMQVRYEMVDGTMRAVSCLQYDRERDAFIDMPLPFDDDEFDRK